MSTFLAPVHIYLFAHVLTTEILLRAEVSISTMLAAAVQKKTFHSFPKSGLLNPHSHFNTFCLLTFHYANEKPALPQLDDTVRASGAAVLVFFVTRPASS